MRIYVVGRVTVEHGSNAVYEGSLPGNQGRLALAMLAVEHRHPLGRDELANELWPDRLPRSWQTALRAVVSKVRASLLGVGLGPEVIGNAFGCYQLRLGDGWLDLEAATEALHMAETRLGTGDPAGAATHATLTCLICSRPFLPGSYGEWTTRQREHISELHVEARECLAEAHAQTGDFTLSARAARKGLAIDPYRDSLYRRLIRSRALSGDRMGAASVFARYREVMIEELGVEPSPETVDVFHESVMEPVDR